MATQLPEPAEIGELLENAYKEIAAGFPARAEPVLRDAIRVLPDQTTGVETCLLRLGEICAERGHYADAIRLNLRLLHDLKLRHGENNPKVVATMNQLAALYENSGRFEEAEFFKARLASLEERIVEAPVLESGNLAEQNVDASVADPAWLSKAYAEANRLYGKAEAEPQTTVLANIIVSEEEKTAHYTRSDLEPDIEDEEKRRRLNLPHLSEQNKQGEATKPAQNMVGRLPRDDGPIDVPSVPPPIGLAPAQGHNVRQPQELKSGNYPPIDRAALKELEEKYHKPVRSSGEHQLPLPPAPSAHKKTESDRPEFSHTADFKASQNSDSTAGKPQHELKEKSKTDTSAPVEVQNWAWQIGRVLSSLLQYVGLRKMAPGIAHGGANVSGNNQRSKRQILPEGPGSKTRQSMELPPDSKLTEYARNIARWCAHNLKKLREKNNLIRALIFVVIFGIVGGFFADRFMPRGTTAADIYANCPVSYRTADGDVQFRLSDQSVCQLKTGKYAVQKPYLMYLNDWRDIMAIILGQPFHKQRWLLRTSEGLQSEDGPVLYFTGGPELELADALEHLADETNTYFGTYSSYPNSTQGLTRLVYQNPYSGKEEMPAFRHLVLDAVKGPNDKLLPNLLARVSKDEPKSSPGSISLCTIALRSNEGTRKIALIRAFGRNGKPLTGSVPGSIDCILSENGGRIETDSSRDLLFSGTAVRPEQFWLIERGTDENTLFWLHWGSTIFFGAIAAILYGLYKFVQPENQTKDIMLLLVRTFAVITAVLAWLEHAL